MRPFHTVFGVACSVALAVACSSSSSPSSSSPDSGGGGDDGASASSSGGTSSSSSGGMGLGDGAPMATITCYSAADCNEGGTGKVCCYSLTTMATSCVSGQCAMGDFTQCASSDSECPAGYHCIQSPLGATVHYCAMGDAGAGGDARAGDGAAGEGGTGDAAAGDGAAE